MADAEYESIVTTMDRPILVLAGPGAGKTFLLGDRTKRLLDSGIAKESITLLAFGNEASKNMKNRLLDPNSTYHVPYDSLPHISTLHSLGFEIVNRNPGLVGLKKNNLQVQSNERVKNLLFRDAALIIGLNEADGKDALKFKQIGFADPRIEKKHHDICEAYWRIMSKCNYIDFDDQVYFAYRVLEGDPSILQEYRTRCQHLLVDEYQDINAAQYKMIRMLSRESRNGLFVVGDDAQSIYGFRGGDPHYILQFQDHYRGAATPPLAHSRRCHRNILEDASRMLKSFYSSWSGPFTLEYHSAPGEQPYIWQLQSDNAEAEWIASMASQAIALSQYGVPHSCPVNLLSDQLNDRLLNISHILEWLKEPHDNFLTRLAIEALMNHGKAKVPGADKSSRCSTPTIQKRIGVETEVASLWDGVTKKTCLFSVLHYHSEPSKELEIVRDTLNTLLDIYGKTKREIQGEFAKYLSIVIGDWAEGEKIASDLSQIIRHLSVSEPMGFNTVQLMTMRKAKGLEADVVIIAGLEDDLLPNPRSDIEEEARLFYVSMTRAKQKLYLFHAYKRLRSISYGEAITNKPRSRFLDAIGRRSDYMRD